MKIKQALQTVEYRIVYAVIYAISLLPIKFLYGMASFTFFLAYYIIGYRKEVVIQNIARSFPHKRGMVRFRPYQRDSMLVLKRIFVSLPKNWTIYNPKIKLKKRLILGYGNKQIYRQPNFGNFERV